MDEVIQAFESWPLPVRILVLIVLALLVHFLLRGLETVSRWLLTPRIADPARKKEQFGRQHPKVATVAGLIVSAIAFAAYFVALGLILHQFGVNLTAYLATASVIGLAIAFGSQSLVQDVVIGLTMLFSNAFHLGDLVEISGQIGRVESVGLRFTRLINLHGQEVYVPNRTITTVSRFRHGAIRAYADIQKPARVSTEQVKAVVDQVARGMRAQYNSLILSEPRFFDWKKLEAGDWEYLRIRFHLWPGQGALIETTFRHRVVAALKKLDPDYADWMVTVIYRTW